MKYPFLCIVTLIAVLLIVSTGKINAQVTNRVAVDASGSLLRVKNTGNENVEGSPYLLKNWVNGSVKFADAMPAKNVSLKLDLLENLLVVKGKDETENLFSAKVIEFTLNEDGNERLFKGGFIDSKGDPIPCYLEVLYDGKTKFLVREIKTIIESKGYNTATITKKIDDTKEYYISKGNNTAYLVRLTEKSIIPLLEKPELTNFIKENKLSLKNKLDVVKLLQYYDSQF